MQDSQILLSCICSSIRVLTFRAVFFCSCFSGFLAICWHWRFLNRSFRLSRLSFLAYRISKFVLFMFFFLLRSFRLLCLVFYRFVVPFSMMSLPMASGMALGLVAFIMLPFWPPLFLRSTLFSIFGMALGMSRMMILPMFMGPIGTVIFVYSASLSLFWMSFMGMILMARSVLSLARSITFEVLPLFVLFFVLVIFMWWGVLLTFIRLEFPLGAMIFSCCVLPMRFISVMALSLFMISIRSMAFMRRSFSMFLVPIWALSFGHYFTAAWLLMLVRWPVVFMWMVLVVVDTRTSRFLLWAVTITWFFVLVSCLLVVTIRLVVWVVVIMVWARSWLVGQRFNRKLVQRLLGWGNMVLMMYDAAFGTRILRNLN